MANRTMAAILGIAGAVGSLVAWLAPLPALAQDHPLLGRYEGATQVGYRVSAFDEARIIVGPMEENTSAQQRGAGWQTVEGKVTILYYRLPEGRTALEALRNYQASLTEKRFAVTFTCSTEAGSCFIDGQGYPGIFLGLALDGPAGLPTLELGDVVRNFFGNGNGRYLYAKLDRPGGAVHASLAFSDDPNRERVVIARMVETGAMEAGKIQVTEAGALKQDLDTRGRADVYGILFDTDKAAVKPDSQPQLKAIADVLARSPGLKLDVVGHTDNQGGAAYNQRLSEARAAAVVAELTARYGIERARLASRGRGLDQPVASNVDEAGRAQNRRVELVKR